MVQRLAAVVVKLPMLERRAPPRCSPQRLGRVEGHVGDEDSGHGRGTDRRGKVGEDSSQGFGSPLVVHVKGPEARRGSEGPTVALKEGAQALEALGDGPSETVLSSTLQAQKEQREKKLEQIIIVIVNPISKSIQVQAVLKEETTYLADEHAIDGRRGLVGAVATAKLLNGLVCRPGKLERDVEAPSLVPRSLVGLEADAS